MTENDRDIDLLRTNPNQFVVKYQKHIRIVVKQCISYGWFPPSDFQDIIQTINLELLGKIGVIRQQYNGTTFLRTYVSHIALNICRKLHQTHQLALQLEALPDVAGIHERDILKPLVIEETKDAFEKTLSLYSHRLPKISLFLTILSKLPATPKAVLECYPQCEQDDLNAFLQHFSGRHEGLSEGQIMEQLAPFINKMEKSTTSSDGYRRWIDSIIQEVCDVLNGDPPHARFTRENILFLFEQFAIRSGKKNYVRVKLDQAL